MAKAIIQAPKSWLESIGQVLVITSLHQISLICSCSFLKASIGDDGTMVELGYSVVGVEFHKKKR